MIGVYVDNVYVPWIESIYRLADKAPLVLFLNNFGAVDVHSDIAVLPSLHIWSFNGPIIAGDTFSARYLADCTVVKDKYFYINTVDWNNHHFAALDVLKATSLKLASEPALAPLVKATFGEPTQIKNWNYEDIKRLLG